MLAPQDETLKVIFLGVSGVLHPSQSLYELLEVAGKPDTLSASRLSVEGEFVHAGASCKSG